MAGLSGNWLKERAAGAGVGEVGGAEVMRDYPGLGWGWIQNPMFMGQHGQKSPHFCATHVAWGLNLAVLTVAADKYALGADWFSLWCGYSE
jgi:hypothetical protein